MSRPAKTVQDNMLCEAMRGGCACTGGRNRALVQDDTLYEVLQKGGGCTGLAGTWFRMTPGAAALEHPLADFIFRKSDDFCQLPPGEIVLPPEGLCERYSLGCSEPSGVPCAEQSIAPVTADLSGFSIVKRDSPFFCHPGLHFLFLRFGTGKIYAIAVRCAEYPFESRDVNIIGWENQIVAYQPIVWN